MSGDRYVGEQPTAADIPSTQATDAEVSSAVSAHVAAADPHPGYVLESREGQANGIGTLGPDGRQPAAQRSNPSWTTFPGVVSEEAMLALSTAIPGDQAIRTDFSPSRRYTLSADDYTQVANWYLDSNPFGTILGVASGDITGVSVTDGGAGNAGKAFIGDAGGRLDGRDVGADGATLDAHVANVSNPHSVTAVQVGADPTGSAAAVQTNLTTHLNNATGAHAASAIAVTPSGNLAATTVAAALTEHQGDIDTINSTIASLPISQGGSGGTSGSPATIDGVANAGGDINLIQGTATIITPDNGVAKSITIGVDATATSTANKVPIGDSGGQLKGEWAGTGTPTTASMLFGGGAGTAPAWATISAKTEATTGASTDRLLIDQGGVLKSIQLGNLSGLAGSGATVTGTGAIAYTVRTADIAMTRTTGAALDCTTDALVATLPTSPMASDIAGVMRYAGTTCRSYVRPAALGANILGSPQLVTLGTTGLTANFQWIDSTMGWSMSLSPTLVCPLPSGTQFLMLPGATWSTGFAKDHSGNGYNATEATNPPTNNPTGINNGPAWDFDGSNDKFTADAAILNTTGAWFLAFTFNADDTATTQTVISKQDLSGTIENSMTVQITGNAIYAYAIDEAASAASIGKQSSAISAGTRYTMVITYDGGSNTTTSVKMYMNGVDQTTTSNSGTFGSVTSAAGLFRIGHRLAAGGSPERLYNGKINWIIAGTGTPSAAQIAAWYTFGNSL